MCHRVESAAAAAVTVDANSLRLSVCLSSFVCLSVSSSSSVPVAAKNEGGGTKNDNKVIFFFKSLQTAVCAHVRHQSMNLLFPVSDAAWQLHSNPPASGPHVAPPTFTAPVPPCVIRLQTVGACTQTHTHSPEKAPPPPHIKGAAGG